MPQAAPPKTAALLGWYDFRADAIEVNIVNDADQRGGVFDEERIIAPLKEVASFAAKAIEARGECTLQPVQAADQIRQRCFESEMKMISHDGISVQPPTVAQA